MTIIHKIGYYGNSLQMPFFGPLFSNSRTHFLNFLSGSRSRPALSRARGGGGARGLQPPHFFENYKELLRKKCFSAPPL